MAGSDEEEKTEEKTKKSADKSKKVTAKMIEDWKKELKVMFGYFVEYQTAQNAVGAE